MLAATPSTRQNPLELVRLALSMVEAGERDIPESLKKYFLAVLSQARTLAKDPPEAHGELLPEAIELALEIRTMKEFSEEIDRIETVDKISPDVAKKLLSAMEQSPVYQDRPTPPA